jgi:predicted dehydrogenase
MLRLGLLGAARITPRAIIEPASQIDGVAITAIAARDAARAAEFAAKHAIPHVASSYEALLARDDVDMVYVALPTALHAPWCLAALKAGKHVICEKPFSMSARETQSVLDAAAGAGLRVIEATHNRYHPLLARVRDLAQSGEIGAIRDLDVAFEVHVRLGEAEFRRSAALGGGAFRDLGHYCVHFARTVLGQEPLSAQLREVIWDAPNVDALLSVSCVFPGGAVARLEAGMLHDRPQRADAIVRGEKGEIRVRNFVAPQYGATLDIVDENGAARREDVDPRATFAFQMESLVAAMASGAPMPTEGGDILMQSRALDLAYAAALSS